MTSPGEAPGSTRLHGLDALRGGALILGIVLHALIPFTVETPWLVKDQDQSPVADVTNYVIHLFRMTLFLVLAGYFGRMMLTRRGVRRFLGDRLKRIALPLVVFWPVAVLPLALLSLLNLHVRNLPQPTDVPTDPLLMITPGHLWFLLILMECYLLMLAVRAMAPRLLGTHTVQRLTTRATRTFTAPLGVMVVALPYAATLLLQNEPMTGGIAAPTTILPDPISLISYFGAFTVGWCLQTDSNALHRLSRPGAWIHLAVAAGTTALGWVLLHHAAMPAITASVMAIAAWSWVYALLGLCIQYLTRERASVRYLADASYWMYLMHLPLLVAIEIPLADLGWPIIAKLAVALTTTFLILLASYALMVRTTPIGRWLNGRTPTHRAAQKPATHTTP
ncbi:acyltransferase family protein [Actinopolymorpha alba]|uniref:acyltransferase family protein n=1 Tax=Actinopolymorpha alba TaxID=533267 RepID=UPI0003743C15|nr:acyltransferase family protein [Actinopolymorpha alba]